MANIDDIPLRDGEDGSAQLISLRAYLKDSDSSNYKYTDGLLIDNLVLNDPVTVWQNLSGKQGKIPWSYSATDMTHVNRVRYQLGDTDKLDIEYTDDVLERYLEAIPARYVVSCLTAVEEEGSTLPDDKQDPLYILRDFAGDTSAPFNNTDKEMLEDYLRLYVDPYTYLLKLLDNEVAKASAASGAEAANGLATFDGISFEAPELSSEKLEDAREQVKQMIASSIYLFTPCYNIYVDGEGTVDTGWEEIWYEL